MNEKRQHVLILFAHPALHKSRVNRPLFAAVQDLEHVTAHDLYEAYPEFHIDVKREQRLLEAHDVIVLQHPFYWYSTPALIKEWQDLVLEHGWAYGRDGNALRGKLLLSAITAGGGESAYKKQGANRFTIRELLAPIEQTATLCGMDYLPPFVVHGTHGLTQGEIERHADDYKRVVLALRDHRLDIESARGLARLNERLDDLIAD
jgi:glutathione-regulated potassium-efflux system ancillary protein KefG